MLDEYKGIKRSQSKEIFYWLDNYCNNQDPKILEDDIVLQSMVKKHLRKRSINIIAFNVGMWSLFVYFANELTKGY